MSLGENRVEDLEEALRRIVLVISPDACHQCCDRDAAAVDIALDALGLDPVVPLIHSTSVRSSSQRTASAGSLGGVQ